MARLSATLFAGSALYLVLTFVYVVADNESCDEGFGVAFNVVAAVIFLLLLGFIAYYKGWLSGLCARCSLGSFASTDRGETQRVQQYSYDEYDQPPPPRQPSPYAPQPQPPPPYAPQPQQPPPPRQPRGEWQWQPFDAQAIAAARTRGVDATSTAVLVDDGRGGYIEVDDGALGSSYGGGPGLTANCDWLLLLGVLALLTCIVPTVLLLFVNSCPDKAPTLGIISGIVLSGMSACAMAFITWDYFYAGSRDGEKVGMLD